MSKTKTTGFPACSLVAFICILLELTYADYMHEINDQAASYFCLIYFPPGQTLIYNKWYTKFYDLGKQKRVDEIQTPFQLSI